MRKRLLVPVAESENMGRNTGQERDLCGEALNWVTEASSFFLIGVL